MQGIARLRRFHAGAADGACVSQASNSTPATFNVSATLRITVLNPASAHRADVAAYLAALNASLNGTSSSSGGAASGRRLALAKQQTQWRIAGTAAWPEHAHPAWLSGEVSDGKSSGEASIAWPSGDAFGPELDAHSASDAVGGAAPVPGMTSGGEGGAHEDDVVLVAGWPSSVDATPDPEHGALGALPDQWRQAWHSRREGTAGVDVRAWHEEVSSLMQVRCCCCRRGHSARETACCVAWLRALTRAVARLGACAGAPSAGGAP